MKRLANFPLKNSLIMVAVIMLAIPAYAVQLINVTGNGVELTYVSVDCLGANEVGITVAGTTFVGKHISVQNCAAGGFAFNETATLTNSLAISAGDDITIAAGKTVTGTYNLFEDAAKAGAGTYSDGGSTTKWSGVYADRIDTAAAIAGLHTGSTIVGGDAGGNTRLLGSGVDIGAYERPAWLYGPPAKRGLWDAPKFYTVP